MEDAYLIDSEGEVLPVWEHEKALFSELFDIATLNHGIDELCNKYPEAVALRNERSWAGFNMGIQLFDSMFPDFKKDISIVLADALLEDIPVENLLKTSGKIFDIVQWFIVKKGFIRIRKWKVNNSLEIEFFNMSESKDRIKNFLNKTGYSGKVVLRDLMKGDTIEAGASDIKSLAQLSRIFLKVAARFKEKENAH